MGRTLRERVSMTVRGVQAAAYTRTGLSDRRLSARKGAAPILMYHRVIDDAMPAPRDPGMFVRASTFEWQIARLRSRWDVRTLGDLVNRPLRESDPPCAVLTFDDGWRDNLTIAWPILERQGVRATIFLVRDNVAGGMASSGDFLRPDEIRDLADRGIEFGAHTVSHPFLDLLHSRDAERQMKDSKDAVAAWTGRPCETFAYPAGRFNPDTPEIARTLFRASVTVETGWWTPSCDPARIPRLGIHQDVSRTPALFDARLAELL